MHGDGLSAYVFRPGVIEDLNFIRNSWAISYYKGSGYHHHLSSDAFNHHHRPIREKILGQPNVAMIVCVGANDPDVILGWVLVEVPDKTDGLIVHYIYVKQAFKGEHIATELYQRATGQITPIYISHVTRHGDEILSQKKLGLHYIPHLI